MCRIRMRQKTLPRCSFPAAVSSSSSVLFLSTFYFLHVSFPFSHITISSQSCFPLSDLPVCSFIFFFLVFQSGDVARNVIRGRFIVATDFFASVFKSLFSYLLSHIICLHHSGLGYCFWQQGDFHFVHLSWELKGSGSSVVGSLKPSQTSGHTFHCHVSYDLFFDCAKISLHV